jgi:hypothetical protein
LASRGEQHQQQQKIFLSFFAATAGVYREDKKTVSQPK